MLEVAEIIRLHGAAYLVRFADRILPSHRRALRDLEACRTPALGGHVHQCDHCGRQVYAYHSCRNRHCPKCHRDQTDRWLTAQRARLLPCAYYLLTFTLPDALRPVARSHQKTMYGLLMKSAAAALLTLTRDPRYVGGRLGCLAVLHTWTRALLYHPHVHLLVTAGGLSADGTAWVAPKYENYLVPVHALSQVFRAKICAALNHAGLLDQVPRDIWTKPWVVHCQHAGGHLRSLDGRAAPAVHRYAACRVRQACSHADNAADVDALLGFREGAAPDHIFDFVAWYAGAREQGPDDVRTEIVRAHPGESALSGESER